MDGVKEKQKGKERQWNNPLRISSIYTHSSYLMNLILIFNYLNLLRLMAATKCRILLCIKKRYDASRIFSSYCCCCCCCYSIQISLAFTYVRSSKYPLLLDPITTEFKTFSCYVFLFNNSKNRDFQHAYSEITSKTRRTSPLMEFEGIHKNVSAWYHCSR